MGDVAVVHAVADARQEELLATLTTAGAVVCRGVVLCLGRVKCKMAYNL
jgi:hypothetical protein